MSGRAAGPLVISIQSHVAYGYVGNRAACFPLERLGLEVVAVNTVQLSNHTGYPTYPGDVFGADHVRRVLSGVAERGVYGRCGGLLSGYLGGADLAEAVAETVDAVKAAAPGALYLCDPVMGDREGGLYVPPDQPERFRQLLLPRADIIAPNHYELEVLAGAPAATGAELLAAAQALRARGPGLALITSAELPEARPDTVTMILVGPDGAHAVETPRLSFREPPNGAGDLTSALFLGRLLQGVPPVRALELTAASLAGVYARTHREDRRELALVAAQNELHTPTRNVQARRLDG